MVKQRPARFAVSVLFAGNWFWIDGAAVRSKGTYLAFAAQAGALQRRAASSP
jgi:hypothetical protein